MTRVAGVVLCGGRSLRMGREKALIDAGGRPLAVRLAERLAAVADPVFLAPGTPGRLGPLGFPEVADEVPGTGPLGGLAGALAASPHRLVAAVAVDMPFASAEVFRLLVSLYGGEDAVVPVTEMGREPLHALYGTSALPHLRASLAANELGLRRALEALRVRDVLPERWRSADPTGRFARNLNRPEDLALLDGSER